MTNVKTAQNCPRCKAVGTVIEQSGKHVILECSCKTKWQSLSSSCKTCGKPTGFVSDGYCGKCYGERIY